MRTRTTILNVFDALDALNRAAGIPLEAGDLTVGKYSVRKTDTRTWTLHRTRQVNIHGGESYPIVDPIYSGTTRQLYELIRVFQKGYVQGFEDALRTTGSLTVTA
jgi:hypothetical protein